MTKKYFLNNFLLALGLLIIGLFVWFDTPRALSERVIWFLALAVASTFLFPFSKIAIEKFFLSFTSKKFWTTGILRESSGKTGLYAMYYIVCFALAIPLGGAYFLYFLKKRVISKDHS